MTSDEFILIQTISNQQLRLSSELFNELIILMKQKSLPPYSNMQLLLEELTNNMLDINHLLERRNGNHN